MALARLPNLRLGAWVPFTIRVDVVRHCQNRTMLISKPVADGIRSGTITMQYRRWDAPRVPAGGRQLTPAGLIEFGAVTEIKDVVTLTDRQARAAGFRDAAALRKALAPRPTRQPSARGAKGGERIYRIRVRWVGEDPRLELREQVPDEAELAELAAKVARLDVGKASGPWTRQVLEWIRDNPQVVSKELATLLGRELLPLKVDIRKLKALGLTISHEVGYELSVRGRVYLASLDEAGKGVGE